MVRYIQYCCFSGPDTSFNILKRDHYVSRADSAPETQWSRFRILNDGLDPGKQQH
jgi:hypothetical protein